MGFADMEPVMEYISQQASANIFAERFPLPFKVFVE